MRLHLFAVLPFLIPFSAAGQSVFLQHPKQAGLSGNQILDQTSYSEDVNRAQAILDPQGFESTGVMTIRGVRFRPPVRRFEILGVWIEMSMRLALAPRGVNSQNASATFDANVDKASVIEVFSRKRINLPALPTTRPWPFRIPFDSGKTFAYPGTNAGRSLVAETRVYDNQIDGRVFSYWIDGHDGNVQGTIRQNGPYSGCRNSMSKLPHIDVGPQHLYVGSKKPRFVALAEEPGIAQTVFLIGGRSTTVSLPGGCALKQVPIYTAVVPASGPYSASFLPLPIPNVAALAGLSFFTQAFWYQPKANSLGLISSKSLVCTISPKLPALVSTLTKTVGRKFYLDPDKVTKAEVVERGLAIVHQFHN